MLLFCIKQCLQYLGIWKQLCVCVFGRWRGGDGKGRNLKLMGLYLLVMASDLSCCLTIFISHQPQYKHTKYVFINEFVFN
jgi:hypothetical protein